jgi:hypothetical protein
MNRALVLLLPLLALPEHAMANTIGCGGNTFSYAEVVEARQGRHRAGPIEVMPDSVCADLIELRRRQIESLNIVIDPRERSQQPPTPQP